MAFRGGSQVLREDDDAQTDNKQEPTDDSDGLFETIQNFNILDNQDQEPSEKSEHSLLSNVPSFEDVTTQLTDPQSGTIGQPPKEEVGNVPVVGEVVDTVTDTLPVEDLIQKNEYPDSKIEKSKKSEDDQLNQNIDFTDDETTVLDSTEKSLKSQIEVDNVPLADTDKTSKTEPGLEASPVDVDKSLKGQDDLEATPITEEIIVDSIPKDDTWNEETSELSQTIPTPLKDNDEDNLSSDQSEHLDQTENLSEKPPIMEQSNIPQDDTSDKTEHDKTTIDNDESVLYHEDTHSYSTIDITDLHSAPVHEEYAAETEVVAHIPEHHSMKSNSAVNNMVNKHLEDSSNSSEDEDSGVSKIELTNVKHDSNEHQDTFQTGHSNADASLFGATSESYGHASTFANKTVNTEVNKIKLQHGRKSSIHIQFLSALVWLIILY